MIRKVGFPLEVKDGWPPYDIEHIWVEIINLKDFRVLNFPFFVKGIAFDDIIQAEIDDHGYIISWKIIEQSDNSTMWIMESEDTDIGEKLDELGCGVEEDRAQGIMAVNVPHSTNIDKLNSILESYEKRELISVAVPVDRIGLR